MTTIFINSVERESEKATHFTATQCVLKKDFKNIYIL